MKNIIKRGIKSEKQDIKEIWNRIKKRDFSGNMGLAVKNSVYQFSTTLIAKIGSLIFTIILARLLLPELFGLYSLALSTIIIFASISDLGISQTLIRFVSKELGKKSKKVKSYLFYLGKIKIILILVSAFLLLISAKSISHNFYQKPIFLALLAGVLYIVFIHTTGFLQSILQAANSFRGIFKKEILYQISRIILIPLVVFFSIKYSLSNEIILMLIILFLAFCLFLISLFLIFDIKKVYSKNREKGKYKKLSQKKTKIINKFILATAALALSGVFFSSIDRVMLGIFVKAEFIGYYAAAFSLIGGLASIMGFGAVVLLPIFSRLRGKRLEKGFKKSIRLILFFSIATFLVTILLSYFIILIVYGEEYLSSLNIFRLLSVLLIALPLIGMYSSYFISKGSPQIIARILVISTILNIILNYILITSLLKYGNLAAVYGATIATLISQFVYLGALFISKKKIAS